jgi:exodeoxyribonuclease VII small subunit
MPKPKSKAALPIEDLTYEQAFEEMEAIVQQLEAGQLSLDESLALFERGQALSARCQKLLETAELRVQQLAPRPGGGLSLQPFEDGDA